MKKDLHFSKREARALLWLLPVLAVISWLVWGITRTNGRAEPPQESDAYYPSLKIDGTDGISPSLQAAGGDEAIHERPFTEIIPQLFEFDPNTIEYHDLVRLGFTRGEALGIIKYRERGKVFEIPEDFAACYQVSEEIYRRLEPYIAIGERFRLKPLDWAATRGEDVPASLRGADGDVAIQDTISGLLRTSSPRNDVLVDLNTADSAALISVSGIGERTVSGIMEYRERLGGFVAVEQLAEVRGVTEQNYERMIEQIYVDPAAVQKININFAPAKSLAAHPYMKAAALRKLLKQRQLEGGWRSLEELKADDIFTGEELSKLGPYLVFN